jgi:lipopolysaccharide transport protein LptA
MLRKIEQYSRLIKLLKYFFVAIALTSISIISYYIIVNQNSKIQHNTSTPDIQKNSEPDVSFKVNQPDLTGISLEHGPYYIQADKMEELAGQVFFVNPKVKSMLNHLDWLNIIAKKAKLTINDNHLQLFDDLKANLNKQYYLSGEQAEILHQESIIRSDHYSKLYTDEYNLESDNGFTLNYQNETAFFYGKINANIKQHKDKFTTNIKSDKLDVFWPSKTGHFLGHVILLRDGTKVEADKMTAIISSSSNKLEKIYTYGNVKITDQENIATSEYGEYIVSTSILTLKDQVKLYKDGNVLSGELLHYSFLSKKADLVGSPQKNNGRVRAVIIPKNAQ